MMVDLTISFFVILSTIEQSISNISRSHGTPDKGI